MKKSRINAIRIINQLIEKHNEEVEKYNSVAPHEKRDVGKYKKENLIWEWGLNAMLSKPINRKLSEEMSLVLFIGIINFFIRGFANESQDEYVPFLNKLI